MVAFNIKNDKGKEESWYLDLKDKGVVGKGAAPEGGKADGEFKQLFAPDDGSDADEASMLLQ